MKPKQEKAMKREDVPWEIEQLTDDAGAHETHALTQEQIAKALRDEIRRLGGEDVPGPAKSDPSKRAVWALTEAGLVRRLRKLTADARSGKGCAMTAEEVRAALREELDRMCQPV
jgi:hypothetical protein